MASYTASVTGNWSSTATWGGSGPPGAGDTATINVAVTVTADTTIGAGTATTCLTFGSAGTLTITGAKFTLRGNCVGGGSGSGTILDFLVVNPSGSTQGGVEFDGNSGVAPSITAGEGSRIVSNGTSAGNCYFRTKVGTAGNNGYITDGGNPIANYWLATYTNFTALGSSSVACNSSQDIRGTFPSTWSFTNCTFNGCGLLTVSFGYAGTFTVLLENCLFESTLNATYCIEIITSSVSVPGSVTGCVFLNRANFYAIQGFSLTNNYFADSLTASDAEPLWAEFDGNFVTRANDDGVELIAAGPMTNNYFYTAQMTTDWFFLISSIGSLSVSQNVGEYAGTAASVLLFGQTEEAASPCTQTFNENICFSSGTGGWSTAVDLVSMATETTTSVVTHNTFIVKQSATAGAGSPIAIYSSNAAPADSFTVKANILINTGTTTACYALDNLLVSPYLKVDAAPAAAVTNNCWQGFAAAPATQWTVLTPVTSATTISDGTVYFSPMSGATAPGANDLASTNPSFHDTTRTLASWGGTTAGGGTATAAAAMAALQANPSLVKQATTGLLAYVRGGYAPTNAALKAASYAGDASTTDAAGVAWPGAGPGIGAMGVYSAGAPTARAAALLAAM